jgi:GntR family transcriptional regulator
VEKANMTTCLLRKTTKYYILHYNSNALLRKGAKTILNPDSSIPIYKQIAQWIESEILNGHLEEDQKVFSQYQLADMFTINPATAAKGINLLVDEQILYKKRGLGMFVTSGAKKAIQYKRKNETLMSLITELILEANRLNITKKELIQLMDEVDIEEEGQN